MPAPPNTLKIVEDCVAIADAIAAMTVDAFTQQYGTGEGEAALIAGLRADGDVVVELAAFQGHELVGHILFSRAVDEPFTGTVAGLAPMCARVGHQRQGIGRALIRAGLDLCRARDVKAVIVLGDNDYYGRFGFSAALAEKIACDYAGPQFQVLELEPGALSGTTRVAYAPAFSRLDG
jgi:putative acetyltransferase